MPTAILVDSSLSLARPLGVNSSNNGKENESTNRKELLQRGVLHFLQVLEEHHPLEYTSLISFSSSSKIMCPFTRDYATLKSSLYDLKLQDKSLLDVGLTEALLHISDTWGTDCPAVQIIIVVDAHTGCVNTNQEFSSVIDSVLSVPVKIHVVAFGSSVEGLLLTSSNGLSQLINHQSQDQTRHSFNYEQMKLLQTIATKTMGTFQFVQLPHNSHMWKHSFDQISSNHYSNFTGTLVCGHLSSPISLYPNPNSIFGVHQNLEKVLVPSTISIVGFIPTRKLSCPPSTSRHVILPSTDSSSQLSLGSSTNGSETNSTNDTALCLLLNECLKSERMTALITLSKERERERCALIHSLAEKDRSCLVLSILPPHFNMSWIGSISHLSPVSRSLSTQPKKSSRKRSYQMSKDDGKQYNAKAETIQAGIQRIIRYFRNLPHKTNQLYVECEKLRNFAKIFCLPSLMSHLMDVLTNEWCILPKDAETSQIVNDLFVKLNDPDKPIQLFERQMITPNTPTSQQAPKTAIMSVSSLLN